MSRRLLLTGIPGVRKTTLILRAGESLPGARGFVTEEVRKEGERKGFAIRLLDGRAGMLAEAGRPALRAGPNLLSATHPSCVA